MKRRVSNNVHISQYTFGISMELIGRRCVGAFGAITIQILYALAAYDENRMGFKKRHNHMDNQK